MFLSCEFGNLTQPMTPTPSSCVCFTTLSKKKTQNMQEKKMIFFLFQCFTLVFPSNFIPLPSNARFTSQFSTSSRAQRVCEILLH